MSRKRQCPVCGSKQWHKEPSSGLIACSEGHVLQNYRNEATETEEIGPHAIRKRTLKSTRKKKGRQSKANPKLYHGERGRFHYFQCQQYILRNQIAALSSLWKLPPEFEAICRDVWALHLSLLPNPPPAEVYDHAPCSDTNTSREQSATPREDPGSTSDVDQADSSSSSSSDDREGGDPELIQLMREHSEISSSSSDEGAGGSSTEAPLKDRRTRSYHRYEGAPSLIAVLVLSCWTLRIPVLYRDFARIIEMYQFPYLDPLRFLPQSMTIHLTKHSVQALSPAFAPKATLVHSLTSRLAKHFHKFYGVFTPEVNAAPVLWRVIEGLGGSPTLYGLTKRLSQILSLPLTLHHSLAPHLRVIKARDPESHKYDNVPPEVGFLSAALVVLKMVYGLDGQMRCNSNPADPAYALPRIDEYLHLLKELDKADANEDMFSAVGTMSVDDLSEDLLDKYIQFCHEALSGDGDHGTQVLKDYFPEVPEDVAQMRLHERTRHKLSTIEFQEKDGKPCIRPGERYSIYSSRDVLGTLPEEYSQVLQRGACWLRIEEVYVCGVVERYEKRLMRRWEQDKRRRSREGRMRGGELDEGDEGIISDSD